MVKLQLKYGNINPFGGLFRYSIDFLVVEEHRTIVATLGNRSSVQSAFTYSDRFASLFSSRLCGGDCLEDVMEIISHYDKRGTSERNSPKNYHKNLSDISEVSQAS